MRKRRFWLGIGWVTLALLALASMALFWFNLPGYFAGLGTVCAAAECAAGQLRAADAARLRDMGLSLGAYAAFTTTVYLALTAASWAVTGVLAWRRPGEPVALLAAAALTAQGATAPFSSSSVVAAWSWLFTLLLLVWFVALVNLLYVFPDGRFVPRWTRWAFAPWVAWLALAVAWVLATREVPPDWYWTGLILLTVGIFGLGGLAQIYRYRRVSTGAQRQQTKWVVAGFAVLIGSESVWALYSELAQPLLGLPALTGLGYEVISTLLNAGMQMLVPVTIGAAILRYRLWDIDVVIQRTLVYSVLTALLTAAYFASVVVLQTGAMALTGQRGSALVTVLSTLLIAALFMPLRAGVQGFIDRRFFRRKYDAARTLAEFGANLRDDVDLAHLRATLLTAVGEVMQPEHAGLWIPLDVRYDIGEYVPNRRPQQRQDDDHRDGAQRHHHGGK